MKTLKPMIEAGAQGLRLLALATLSLGLTSALAAAAGGDPDAAELARALVPDTSPEQRFDTARREAYGAFHQAQADCAIQPASERKACLRDARQQLEVDLKAAQAARKQPMPE